MRLLEVNAKNLRRLCGLNGFTIRELAQNLGVSEALLYQAVSNPRSYPSRFAQIKELLPLRTISGKSLEVANV